ncbi:MAG: tRNA (N6-threonylcarbamoyladenosine(37)-N6)-methyltransferase TrmO [Bacteroidales bacterium]|nr:tRNA (N6-threonylcarbamoyladenosine(37)-N6)-methyltransferase TrmO [Bacteroidales bacterium]MBR1794298.1 tRNA (N6-threonylcarbamoyladenosine(37)-N6)-methyltransferase TrmO [Bacteroidales bacterium]
MTLEPVAVYRGALGSKFGIPRQSGLVPSLRGRIVFEPSYRNRDALRGLEGFDRIWLIWGFSANRPAKGEWQPTVRPPRLGGNTALGVWATRSPYRPNPLGLSCVELESIDGMELVVRGADLMDGTPIYDIKPYVVYADSFPEARSGFAASAPESELEVRIPDTIDMDLQTRETLTGLLSLDPRPAYQNEPGRVYGMPFGGKEVHFRVEDHILTVIDYA